MASSLPVFSSAPGSRCSVLRKFGVLLGEGREHRVGGADQLGELFVLAADRFHQQPEVVDRAGDVLVAALQFVGDFGPQPGGRQEALERRRQRPPVVVEAFPGARQQGLQVEARFRVQAGEEFVEVAVRGGLGDGQHFAAVELPGNRRARVDLDRHVLESRLGAHQHGRVLVEAGVLGGDVHGHRGDPAAQVHGLDFPDLGAGDGDGLTLAGGDRLGGLEAGLQRVIVLAQHRDPPREVEVLVGEDVAADRGRDQDHRHHRDERRAVALDLVAEAAAALVGRRVGRGVASLAISRSRPRALWRAAR